MNKHIEKISRETGVSEKNISAVVQLLDEGSTIPFISRYRKEMTGSQDEVMIGTIRDRVIQSRDLDKRREAILKSLKEQEKLTPELEKAVEEAETMAVLEDIYLPYKPKRRTKATVAREKGLEPLALVIFEQEIRNVILEAEKFVNPEKNVETVEQALEGARDIIAEMVNENAEVRGEMRALFWEKGIYTSKVISGKEQEAQKYKDYFDWSEPVSKAPSHRVLAMRRGEKEMFLMLDLAPNTDDAIDLLEKHFVKGRNEAAEQVKLAIKDSYKRLLKPSMETEVRLMSKQKADEEAIKVFVENLRQLLLSAPLGQKNVLALDPGFRTGCKVVCLDRQGKLLHNDVIYPHETKKSHESAALLKYLIEKFSIEAIAIGNGTAGRETETFVRGLGLPKEILIVMVNESGASVYSASDVARQEFPDYDVTVRGAVSIGRRLMDPLAELVKIDPKSIGVGQYQHDVDQSLLKNSLDDSVMSCVNAVGVEINTASKELLTYVSGLGPQLAQNIVNYRNEKGPFKSRDEFRKIPRLGDKAFEQAAGFLRIRNGQNPLDASAVHPESYAIVEKMGNDLGCGIKELIQDKSIRSKIDLKKYVTDTVGLPTLNDILSELSKPGRDPRETFESFSFQEGVSSMEDLKPGMKLPGIVTNITAFGAFVDIGVHQDGLVHMSQMADRYISNPNEVVKVQQKIEVTVLEVDVARKRISLSMKGQGGGKSTQQGSGKPHTKKEKPQQEESMEEKLRKLKGMFR